MKHWAEYEPDDPEAGWHAAQASADRADAQEAEAERLRSAIRAALSAMKADDRSNVECLAAAHEVLSRALAD